MFWQPLKHPVSVTNPPKDVKLLAAQLFQDIQTDYEARWKVIRRAAAQRGADVDSLPHRKNVLNDPWFAREAWRWDPFFGPRSVARRAMPGLKVAVGLFAAFLVYEGASAVMGRRAEGAKSKKKSETVAEAF